MKLISLDFLVYRFCLLEVIWYGMICIKKSKFCVLEFKLIRYFIFIVKIVNRIFMDVIRVFYC